MFVTDYAKTFNAAAARPLDEPDCLHSLFAKQPVEYLAAGQALFFEGDEAKHIFEVMDGTLRVFRIISDGRRVITGFLHAGDVIGVSFRDNYIYTAEAITTAKIRRLARRQFEAAVINSESLGPRFSPGCATKWPQPRTRWCSCRARVPKSGSALSS